MNQPSPKRHLRNFTTLQKTALEVKQVTEGIFEINDLDYICYHVSLAPKGLHELNQTNEGDQLSM